MEQKTKKKRRRRRRHKTIDLDSLAEQYKEYVIEALGISYLELPQRVLDEISKEVVNAVVTSTSYKPSVDTIVKRINRYRKQLYKIVSAKILESIDKLTIDQLEFVIGNGEEVLIQYIQDLYKLAKKYNREDLVSMLQFVWEKYGRPTPIQCPKCGFRTIMPDYGCMVCGYVVSENYIREQLNFEERFIEFIKTASVAQLRDIMDIGFILVSDVDMKSPRERIDPSIRIYYPIYLRSNELSLIMEEISSRKIPV